MLENMGIGQIGSFCYSAVVIGDNDFVDVVEDRTWQVRVQEEVTTKGSKASLHHKLIESRPPSKDLTVPS
jgi:hypothetical protein